MLFQRLIRATTPPQDGDTLYCVFESADGFSVDFTTDPDKPEARFGYESLGVQFVDRSMSGMRDAEAFLDDGIRVFDYRLLSQFGGL